MNFNTLRQWALRRTKKIGLGLFILGIVAYIAGPLLAITLAMAYSLILAMTMAMGFTFVGMMGGGYLISSGAKIYDRTPG